MSSELRQSMTFDQWRNQYTNRVKMMARFKTVEAAMECLPHNAILLERWRAGENPNEAADEEMGDWEE